MQVKNQRLPYIVGLACSLVLFVFSMYKPFFWDTLLTSTITQYYFENGFGKLILPTQIDAGHPPLFYIYVTLFYKLFGKNLFAAHLSMLPIILAGFLAYILLLKEFGFSLTQQTLGVLAFFAIPPVLTQYSLVSYDAALLSLYLWALWALLKQKKILLFLLLFFILGVSLRGFVLWCALLISCIYMYKKQATTFWASYLLSLICIVMWYAYHQLQTGWMLATPANGWAAHRGWVDAHQLFKNMLSIARCFLDLGIFVLSVFLLLFMFMKKANMHYFYLMLIPVVLLCLFLLPFTNPVNHRYFIIAYVLMLLNVMSILQTYNIRWMVIVLAVLIAGHKMLYPVPVSNAWDCTLEHQNYFQCKETMLGHIYEQGIDRSAIGTTFPIDASMKQSDMTADTIRMINVNSAGLDTVQYILFSNVCNDFSDEQIRALKSWHKLYRVSNGGIYMELYEK